MEDTCQCGWLTLKIGLFSAVTSIGVTSSLLIILLDMSGVIRALGRIFTFSKLHPVVFIAAHIDTHTKTRKKKA